MQYFIEFLKKLENQAAFRIGADKIFQAGFLTGAQTAKLNTVTPAIKQTGRMTGKRSYRRNDLKR